MRPIRVVPHFHWDREWYLSFETFRDQLVEALDLLLDTFKADDRWTHFHLDGQIALIDDYLDARPEREQELRDHIASGRLSCGPWVTLVDEFLVSGESIVRNLEDGMARAEELGDVMMLGYLPDQFGHIGQIPQLLARAGLERVIVWRGVPEQITKTGFRWTSPDGSSVDALYLPFGYGNGRRMMREPEHAGRHLHDALAILERFLSDEEPALLMAGNDHQQPRPALTDALDELRRDGADIEITSLREFAASLGTPVQAWRGELRSAARANLLPNTYSVRVHQKLERGWAEHLLERYAEPLAALVPGFEWPAEELREAWRLLHLNGAHDSVCGCSTDEVAHAVDDRTDRVTDIATSIAYDALEVLASNVEEAGPLIFNPSPFERSGVPGLGWKVGREAAGPETAELHAEGDHAIVAVDGNEFRFTLEDQGDGGDLYNFCPDGPPQGPLSIEDGDGAIGFAFDGCDAVVSLKSSAPGFVRLEIEIDNRVPDHRLRLVLSLPEPTDSSLAASTFELVRRPLTSEGGINEPPSPCWPARGIAIAGDRGFLSRGVFEYELNGSTLAMTLLRCTGTISRADLATRRGLAGPDVATPEAQMIGTLGVPLGLVHVTDHERVIDTWERYALPLISVDGPGGGEIRAMGTLLDLDVPALSSIRRRDGSIAVTVWNPSDAEVTTRIGAGEVVLGPHRIETITLDGG